MNNKRAAEKGGFRRISILILVGCVLFLAAVFSINEKNKNIFFINTESTSAEKNEDLMSDKENTAAFSADNSKSEGYSPAFIKGYEIKAERGKVLVNIINPDGSRSFLRETNILYNSLGETDKEILYKGIVVDSEEALNEILQDYES